LVAKSSGEVVSPRGCPRTGTVPENGSRFGAAAGTVPYGDSPFADWTLDFDRSLGP